MSPTTEQMINNAQQQQLNNIERTLGRLEGVVSEGFKGVHNRQDIANGRTSKLETRVNKIELKLATYIGGGSVIIFILNLLIPKILEKFK